VIACQLNSAAPKGSDQKCAVVNCGLVDWLLDLIHLEMSVGAHCVVGVEGRQNNNVIGEVCVE
jgi:hypothetical protein